MAITISWAYDYRPYNNNDDHKLRTDSNDKLSDNDQTKIKKKKKKRKRKRKRKRKIEKVKLMVTYDGSVDVPEGSLLAVKDLSFELVAFLIDARLRLGLHKNELPLPGEHFLQPRQILGLVVGQLQSRFVLHRPDS